MENKLYTLKGLAPLLMHAQTSIDRFHPLAREIAVINAKRKKTDEDHLALRRLEWTAGIYWDEDKGPYIPGRNIKSMLVEAGKMDRLGQNVKRGILISEFLVPLQYKGPRTLNELYGDGSTEWVNVQVAVVQRARVMRTRPIFNRWKLDVLIGYDTSIWDEEQLDMVITKAGTYFGIGDYRPEYGRFTIENGSSN